MPESVDINLFSPGNHKPLPFEKFGNYVTFPSSSSSSSSSSSISSSDSASIKTESCEQNIPIEEHIDTPKHNFEQNDPNQNVNENENEKSFVFLSVFKWEERKGWDILIKSYLMEFNSENNVILIILTNAFHSSSDFAEKISEVNAIQILFCFCFVFVLFVLLFCFNF